jgi:hypothetical protein
MDVGKPQTNTPPVRTISSEADGIPTFDVALSGDAVPLTERKAPKSPKRALVIPDDDFDTDSDDSDDSVVEETAQQVLDEADAILKDPKTASVIEAVTDVETDPNDPDAKELIDAVNESGVTDVEVKAIDPGKNKDHRRKQKNKNHQAFEERKESGSKSWWRDSIGSE